MKTALLSIVLTGMAALLLYGAALVIALAPCYGRLASCP